MLFQKLKTVLIGIKCGNRSAVLCELYTISSAAGTNINNFITIFYDALAQHEFNNIFGCAIRCIRGICLISSKVGIICIPALRDIFSFVYICCAYGGGPIFFYFIYSKHG